MLLDFVGSSVRILLHMLVAAGSSLVTSMAPIHDP